MMNSPILVIINQKRRTRYYEVWMLNGGSPIHRLCITTSPEHAVNHTIEEPILLDRHGVVRIDFDFADFDANKLHNITFTLSYIDYTGETVEKELSSMRQAVID